MNQSLSGTSLFHFTNSFANIIGIIKNGFYPLLCFEDGIAEKPLHQLPDMVIPMVCFCDMRISDTDKGRHTKDYGNYAIGVNKQWARTHGICPVLYSWPLSNDLNNKRSYALTERAMGLIYGNVFEELKFSGEKSSNRSLKNILDGLGILLFYTKRYEGYLYKNFRRGSKKVRFYDEREWRYIPVVLSINGEKRFIYDILTSFLLNACEIFHAEKPLNDHIGDDLISMDKRNYLEFHNDQLKIHSLKLSGKDINYIIVEKREEIEQIRDELKKLQHIKSNIKSISILSFQDIRNDY